jgi:serine/threonine protein kinase
MFYFQGLISERYRLQQHLHHGMMSDVYLASDEHLHCNVVFKLVSNDQTESRLRLQSEIQTLLTLTHDHILPVLDHGEYEAYHYLVMPYMKQGTLLKRMSKGRLSEVEVGNILVQVTNAHSLHDQASSTGISNPQIFCLMAILSTMSILQILGWLAFGKGSDLTQAGILIGCLSIWL